jgi:hypothetical protein
VQLSYAHAQGRVLFTHDNDHLKLGALAIEHAGIAYCHQGKHSFGEIIDGLVLIWEVLDDHEMRNRVEFI